MAKLRVKNFGPIKDGFSENDGFMEITPVTVICGNQATGKSTIAKLYSTLTWLEKSTVRTTIEKKKLPKIGSTVKTESGEGKVISLNILKQKYKVDIPEVGIIEVSLNEGN